MGYDWTDSPLEPGIIIKLQHINEVITNLNTERERRGLAPVSITADIIEAAEINDIRGWIDETGNTIGCPSDYSSDLGGQNTPINNAIQASEYELHNVGVQGVQYTGDFDTYESNALNSEDEPYDVGICSDHYGTNNPQVFEDNYTDKFNALQASNDNLRLSTLDSSKNIDADSYAYNNNETARLFQDYHTQCDTQLFTHCTQHFNVHLDSFNESVEGTLYSNVKTTDDYNHKAINYTENCQTVYTPHFSGDLYNKYNENDPYHYESNLNPHCITVNDPYCNDDGFVCPDLCTDNKKEYKSQACPDFCNVWYLDFEVPHDFNHFDDYFVNERNGRLAGANNPVETSDLISL